MPKVLDIFRIVLEGGVRWIGGAENLEAAKLFIKEVSATQPGDFLVVSLDTGSRMEIKAPGTVA